MSANMESCTRFIGMMPGGGTVQLTFEPRLRLSSPPFPWDLGLQVSKSLLLATQDGFIAIGPIVQTRGQRIILSRWCAVRGNRKSDHWKGFQMEC